MSFRLSELAKERIVRWSPLVALHRGYDTALFVSGRRVGTPLQSDVLAIVVAHSIIGAGTTQQSHAHVCDFGVVHSNGNVISPIG